MRPIESAVTFLKRSRVRGALIGGAVLVLVLWIGFIDSHSVWKRASASSELQRLQRENAHLEAQILYFETMLQGPLTDEAIERAAREQYGMRRSGETVYPLHISE